MNGSDKLAKANERLTIEDVREAAKRIAGQVLRTPVLRSPTLDQIAGVELWLNAENQQHIGAFKARGAMHTVGRLSPEQRAGGVITYSSGNHGQAVALAAKSYGVKAHVAMPTDAPSVKIESIKSLGAEVSFAGTTSADRKKAASAVQERNGGVIIPPFDHPHIVAGAATATLELIEQVAAETGGEKLDAVLVPVGGGGLIAGACLVAAACDVKVFSVEPESCNVLARSLTAGERVVHQPGPTLADGLKPVQIGQLNFAIAQRHVTASLLVNDEDIGRSLVSLLLYGKTLVEPSGAAAVGAALARRLPDPASGGPRRVGAILSGGNIGTDLLKQLLSDYLPYPR